MKIALIGYGKMGQMIEKIAAQKGHSIVARITSSSWEEDALKQADICMEFTRPESVLANVRKIATANKAVVIGTTGWQSQFGEVRSIVEKNRIGVLYGANFSLGVNLLLEILKHASKVMNAFEEYDVAGIESHHNKKKDSPSGTALEIAKAVEMQMDRIEKMPFSSIRCGSIPGTHTVFFDSPCDTISISHEARNREGFASGAIMAAEWLQGKKGMYTFSDCTQNLIQRGRSL